MHLGTCEWCNLEKWLTIHHTKYRTGEKVSYYKTHEFNTFKKRVLIFVTEMVCRECHDDIEKIYEEEQRAVATKTTIYTQAESIINNHTYGNKRITRIAFQTITALYKSGRKKSDPSKEIVMLKRIHEKLYHENLYLGVFVPETCSPIISRF